MPSSRPASRAVNSARPTLRDAHKALTRTRIRSAAQTAFLETSVHAVTMEQIAAAAGVSRPTIYVHYADKDEIIADIVASYCAAALELNARIPAPEPSTVEIRGWLDEKVMHYRDEGMSLALLYQAGHTAPGGRLFIARQFMDDVVAAHAERLPAFRAAFEPGDAGLRARAKAEMLIRQITAACEMCAREGQTPRNRAALDVTAEAFRSFLESHAPDSRERMT